MIIVYVNDHPEGMVNIVFALHHQRVHDEHVQVVYVHHSECVYLCFFVQSMCKYVLDVHGHLCTYRCMDA